MQKSYNQNQEEGASGENVIVVGDVVRSASLTLETADQGARPGLAPGRAGLLGELQGLDPAERLREGHFGRHQQDQLCCWNVVMKAFQTHSLADATQFEYDLQEITNNKLAKRKQPPVKQVFISTESISNNSEERREDEVDINRHLK
mmetsp:Transcript_12793/g.14592  ORF Transcript_12793/g.14592 Transcript_12793/m.14592 type:complete len:147 (-) Transcript_12793:1632-2072(-)